MPRVAAGRAQVVCFHVEEGVQSAEVRDAFKELAFNVCERVMGISTGEVDQVFR